MIEKNKESFKEMWDAFKCIKICEMGIREGEEKEKGAEKNEEIMAENIPI